MAALLELQFTAVREEPGQQWAVALAVLDARIRLHAADPANVAIACSALGTRNQALHQHLLIVLFDHTMDWDYP